MSHNSSGSGIWVFPPKRPRLLATVQMGLRPGKGYILNLPRLGLAVAQGARYIHNGPQGERRYASVRHGNLVITLPDNRMPQ